MVGCVLNVRTKETVRFVDLTTLRKLVRANVAGKLLRDVLPSSLEVCLLLDASVSGGAEVVEACELEGEGIELEGKGNIEIQSESC
jgi:hypothetical protein